MFRVSDLIDLPIIEMSTKHAICTVKSVIINRLNNRVTALVCKEGLFSKNTKAILFKNVIKVNLNAVIIPDKRNICTIKTEYLTQKHLSDYGHIIHQIVIDNNEDILGVVRDVYFDPSTGLIRSYELSEGFLDDFWNGRKLVECQPNYKLVQDNLYIGWIK